MITKTERIVSQCPCGMEIIAYIFNRDRGPATLRLYVRATTTLNGEGPEPGLRSIDRCPNCDRDFSKLTPEEVKESWQS
jgi:uncharacterized protein with PIN domain